MGPHHISTNEGSLQEMADAWSYSWAAQTKKYLRISLHNLATWHLTLHHSNL